jgi:hypothetical protein
MNYTTPFGWIRNIANTTATTSDDVIRDFHTRSTIETVGIRNNVIDGIGRSNSE